MIKRLILILFLFFHFKAICNDNIKVTLDKNSPLSFIEGESIFCAIEVENISRDSIKYNTSNFGGIEKITTLDGLLVRSYIAQSFDVIRSHARKTVQEEKPKYNMNLYPALGYGDKFRFVIGDAGLYANKYAQDVDPNTRAHYCFLKAGKYKVYYVVRLFDIEIRDFYVIEILPSNGDNAEYFRKFIKSLDHIEREQFTNVTADLVGKGPNSLLELLEKNLNGVYSESILSYILVIGMSPSYNLFRMNSFYQRRILEIVPQFLKGREWLSNYNNYFSPLYIYNYYCFFDPNDCGEKSIFLDSMLKNLDKCSPILSDTIINKSKKCCPNLQLKNYARLNTRIQK